MSRYFVLIPAAGVGSRFGNSVPKQYLPLNGRAMISHTIRAFSHVAGLSGIYVLLSANDDYWDRESIDHPEQLGVIRCGGQTRASTVRNGLEAIADQVEANDWILVHDAARPCIDPSCVEGMMHTLRDDPVGGLLAMPIPDTIKRGDSDRVVATVPRDNLWLAQTPQMFRYSLLREALSSLGEDVSTDEAQAVEALGASPRLVIGHASNFKVTYPEDVALAEAILRGNMGAL